MTGITITVNGACITAQTDGPLTSGMVGLPVLFSFDEAWQPLVKTAVFRAGGKVLDRIDIHEETTVPWEIMEMKNCTLYVGVYGADQQGALVIPTVWAEVGVIHPGADPSGDESADPSLPVWQQLINQDHAQAQQLGDVETALDGILAIQNALIGGDGA